VNGHEGELDGEGHRRQGKGGGALHHGTSGCGNPRESVALALQEDGSRHTLSWT
jgi:hypothetical protein